MAKLSDAQLILRLRRGGIKMPVHMLKAARAAGLSPALAAALLMKETGGGRNVYGHDPVTLPQQRGGNVTRANYERYKSLRATHGMQGVGPTQLTWHAFQDEADRLAGCWDPYTNMLVGFRILRDKIRRYGVEKGAAAYNGTGPAAEKYGKDFARQHVFFANLLKDGKKKAATKIALPAVNIAGTHFTWAEAERKAGLHSTRADIPQNLRANVVRHAKNLEVLRTRLNAERKKHGLGPTGIGINSWYRTPAHNVEVGGASKSQHMDAVATDITKEEVRRICPWAGGARDFDRIADQVFAKGGFGQYPAGARHADSRGYRARWTSF